MYPEDEGNLTLDEQRTIKEIVKEEVNEEIAEEVAKEVDE